MVLLDVNVLIALLDEGHENHLAAIAFFKEHFVKGWATCPITENGCLRILGHTGYPNGPGSPSEAQILLSSLTAMPGHQFWPDELSLLQEGWPLPSSRHLTDFYLLALAVRHKARFATFDHDIDAAPLPGGAGALWILG